MDVWGIDILLTGAQKALGVPPGLSILIASEAAQERRRELRRVAAYYADLLNWLPSMQSPATYFSTHAVNLFYALRVGLGLIRAEGLATRFTRHLLLASAFRAGMEALGFRLLANPACLAPTLSVLAYPEGIEDESFRSALSERGIVAAGCLGEFKGVGIRFGHMGNIGRGEILQALAAVEDALQQLGVLVGPGAGVAAAQAQFSEPPKSMGISAAATAR
jgi:aspartate aminotransferase-like enzyme